MQRDFSTPEPLLSPECTGRTIQSGCHSISKIAADIRVVQRKESLMAGLTGLCFMTLSLASFAVGVPGCQPLNESSDSAATLVPTETVAAPDAAATATTTAADPLALADRPSTAAAATETSTQDDRVAQAPSDSLVAPVPLADTAESFTVPLAVREELDLYAFAMLHVQRVTVLQERGVQRSLGLTPAQVQPLEELNREVKRIAGVLQTLPPAEREGKLRGEFKDKAEEFRNVVDRTLTAEQQQRVLSVVLQRQRGAITFLLPGVREALQLSNRQLDHLYRLVDDTRNSVDLNRLSNPLVLAQLASRASAARRSAEAQLTPIQQARWQALLGQR
jgi:hypothetical protein